MNYLNKEHKEILEEKFPILQEKTQNPGSLWLKKIK
jgi:hypothetical protein